MGRCTWSDRELIEDCKSISVFSLNQSGVFSGHVVATVGWRRRWGVPAQSMGVQAIATSDPDCAGCVRISYKLSYRLSGKSELVEYNVELEATPCNFGGIRYWFVCPLLRDGAACKERVGKLYLPPHAKYFGCRRCYNLTYRSQKERRSKLIWRALEYM